MSRPTIIIRPITRWPGRLAGSDADRQKSQFSATYSSTLELLEGEVAALGGREAVVQLAIEESDLTIRGALRSGAKPAHPGVVVTFESRHGALTYATDRFRGSSVWRSGRGTTTVPGWHSNLRAIALGLEALRAVNRYGIAETGQQYEGWKALGAGDPIAAGPASMTVEEAARFLGDLGGFGRDAVQMMVEGDVAAVRASFRMVARDHHPDLGGDPETFRVATEARDLLLAEARR